MTQKRCYISGAISGHDPEQVKQLFAKAEEYLKAKGYHPINPLNNGLEWDAPREQHMRADITVLLCCHAIFMLPAWQASRGAKLEKAIAEQIGLEILCNKEFIQEKL